MYEPANRITEIKEMRKDVLFLYEKGLDPETISRRRSVDKNVVLSLIGNYLKKGLTLKQFLAGVPLIKM